MLYTSAMHLLKQLFQSPNYRPSFRLEPTTTTLITDLYNSDAFFERKNGLKVPFSPSWTLILQLPTTNCYDLAWSEDEVRLFSKAQVFFFLL